MSEFAQGILSQIPEADRQIVQKYIKDWDGNVTKKFQSIHEEYKPYKDLGEIDDIRTSLYYTSMLQNDPAQFIQTIQQAMEEAGMSMNEDTNYDPTDQGGGQQQQAPDPYAERFNQMEQMLGTMYEQFTGYTAQQTEAQQMQQLDNLLADMHRQAGEFDEDYILLQLEKGLSPEQAINAWNTHLQKYNTPKKPGPAVLTGNGAVRQQEQVDPSKLSPQQRKEYALQIMQANMD